MLTQTLELGWQSMPTPLHSYSVTSTHAHIRVGLASYACPYTLVLSDLCSRTHTSWASNLCLPLYTRIRSHVLTHTYELGSQSMHASLHSYSVTCAHAHIRVGLHSMHAPLHSYSVICAHAHIRVGPAFNACPATLVFSDLCSRTYTSWASNQCLPLYTRTQ